MSVPDGRDAVSDSRPGRGEGDRAGHAVHAVHDDRRSPPPWTTGHGGSVAPGLTGPASGSGDSAAPGVV